MSEYIIKKEIWNNGRSVLCRAKQKSGSNLNFLIKRYTDGAASEELLKREMEISQFVENYAPKSITVPVIELTQIEGKPCVVMQYRNNGIFLSELMEKHEKKLSFADKAEIGIRVLDSLATLHAFKAEDQDTGVLHLDIHPGNIFMESADPENHEYGTAKFIDFASSEILKGGAPVNPVLRSQTPGFSAPEILEEETELLSAAADLYSVGAVLYKIFTGEKVKSDGNDFTGERFGDSRIISEALTTFLRCSLEYNPKYRYWDALSMKNALKQLKELYLAMERKDYAALYSAAYYFSIPQETAAAERPEFDIGKFSASINQLRRFQHEDRKAARRNYYISQGLLSIARRNAKDVPKSMLAGLLRECIAGANNMGETYESIALFEEMLSLKKHIHLLDYYEILNKAASSYMDLYLFEKAGECYWSVIKGLEEIKKTYLKEAKTLGTDGKTACQIPDLARALSGYGSYLAFTYAKNRENPMKWFRAAICEFGEYTGNVAITQSNILNYALMTKDESLYREYAGSYFEASDPSGKILKKLTDQKKGIHLYQLMIYLKGIYVFDLEKTDDEFDRELISLLRDGRLDGKEMQEHPAQLIYKYIGLILLKKGYNEEASFAAEKSVSAIPEAVPDLMKPLSILMCMSYQTMWIFAKESGDAEEMETVWDRIIGHIDRTVAVGKEYGWGILKQKILTEGGLENILTYMYA